MNKKVIGIALALVAGLFLASAWLAHFTRPPFPG